MQLNQHIAVVGHIPSSSFLLLLTWSCCVFMQVPQVKGTLPHCHTQLNQTYYPSLIKKVGPFDYCLDHFTKVNKGLQSIMQTFSGQPLF